MNKYPSLPPMLARWVKFNAVGGIGVVAQLTALLALKSGLHMNYMAATGLAVEAAIVHNFLWHVKFTWSDRSPTNNFAQFIKFQATTGLFSIAGNLLLMKAFVEIVRMNYMLANCIAIAACSLLNFIASDKFVFRLQSPAAPNTCAEKSGGGL